MNWLKTFIFTLIAPGSVWILFPYHILRDVPNPSHLGVVQWLGIVLALLGLFVYAWTAADFVRVGRGTPAPVFAPDRLVVKGLYCYVRNPMYLGVLSGLVGEVCFFQSFRLLLYTVIVTAAFSVFVILYEEPALDRRFGKTYSDYRARVRRWIPRLKPYRGE